jgi:uncharacterized protein
MGKIAIWILIAVAVMLVLRLIGTGKRRVADDDATPGKGRSNRSDRSESGDDERQRNPGELMMSCAVCGVHIPASDAIFAHGKVFCGPEHRDADASRREAGG